MPEYAFIEDLSAESWESFLSTLSDGNFDQCFAYTEISKMAFPSANGIRLAITVDGDLAGLVQGTYSTYLGFGMSLRIMCAPIIDTKRKESLRLFENLLNALEENAKRKRIIHVKILVPENWKLNDLVSKLGYSPVGKLNGYFINLENGVEELWRNIAHNKRRNINKAAKKGVEVVQSHDIDDLHTFYSMVEDTKKRQGISSYPLSWFEAVWKLYEPEELSKVFLARWKGKAVSGVFVVIHGRTVYALAAGSFTEGWKARPNDMMHWKVMEWACQNGYSKYHMGLVSEPPPTEGSHSWGIWRWKREWKGNLETIQIFDKMLMPRYKLILKGKELAERVYRYFG
jgi:hypothetical protein